MGGVLEFAEALEVVLRHAAGVRVPGVEMVALPKAAERVLAEEVKADRDQPPFDRSTRDGFAVRAKEWTAGKRLRMSGQVRAGEAWTGGKMRAGSAIEIMTGAGVPRGADAVAMLEHAELGGGAVWAAAGRKLSVGENIVERGSQARKGEVLLPAGTAMQAAEIALAAACGRARLAVRKRPTVAVVATGDELVELDETPDERQIYNSNGYALAALVEAAGGRARRLKIARDTRADVRRRIATGRGVDLMILSGGVSAGKYDLVEEVLAGFGAEFFFTGVKMQPGKPVVFGRLPGGEERERNAGILRSAQNDKREKENDKREKENDKQRAQDDKRGVSDERGVTGWTYFFGLPGNPISTQVTFQCFVEPLLRALCGAEVVGPRFVQATLAEDMRGKAGLTRLLPGRLTYDVERPEVRLVEWQGSGDLAANARANCYAVLAGGKDLRAGDVISVLLR